MGRRQRLEESHFAYERVGPEAPGGSRWPVRLRNARRFSSDEDDGDVARLSIQQLLSNSLVDPRRHLDLDRVQRYTRLLDELPPITVFRLEDQTLLLVDGYHRVPPRKRRCGQL
jgi:hypothetical protein